VSGAIDPDSPTDMALLLVRLGHEDGGRVNPDRILERRAGSSSREAFLEAQDAGWLDGAGWVTEIGREALREADDGTD
jgi:hypothetical protein